MPQTAFVFLVGCVAISALPPLNGFVSEWLTFQADLLSPELPQWGVKILVPAVGAMLALSAALAAACFVKAFGVTFLGRPRTPAAARRARPTGTRSQRCISLRRFALSRACCPGLFIDALAPVAREPSLAAACRRRRDRDPGSRSCRSRRAAAPMTACSSSSSSRLRHARACAIHRLASARCDAARHGIAAIPIRARDAIHRRQLRAADPPRFRDRAFHARERVEMPPPGDMRRGGASRSSCTISIWEWLYAPIAAAVELRGGAPQPSPIPDYPPLSELRFLALVFLLLVLRYGSDPRSRHPGLQMLLVLMSRRRWPGSCAR